MVHKILFVIDNLEFGGGERGFLQLIKKLDRNKYRIHVAATAGGEFNKTINEMDIPIFPVDMSYKYNLQAIKTLSGLINKEKYNIVHSQGARADFFARIAVRFSHRPYLISTIQMPVDGFNVNILKKCVYRILDRILECHVDRFIVVSDRLKRILIDSHRIPPEKIVKIYNGIEVDRFNLDLNDTKATKIRKSLGINGSHTVIGGIGRLTWQKGFKYLMYSVPSIIQNHQKTKILIVGDGPLKNKLIEIAEKLDIKENIIFTGFRNDIDKILAAIDIFVVPSILEGFPMVILESMAMARPIIASNIPGISEQIIADSTGVLVPPEDSVKLGNAIVELLADRTKAKKIGENAREYVENNYSVENMISKTDQLYQSLLNE